MPLGLADCHDGYRRRAGADDLAAPELSPKVINRHSQVMDPPSMAQRSGRILPHNTEPSDAEGKAQALDVVAVESAHALDANPAFVSEGVATSVFLPYARE